MSRDQGQKVKENTHFWLKHEFYLETGFSSYESARESNFTRFLRTLSLPTGSQTTGDSTAVQTGSGSLYKQPKTQYRDTAPSVVFVSPGSYGSDCKHPVDTGNYLKTRLLTTRCVHRGQAPQPEGTKRGANEHICIYQKYSNTRENYMYENYNNNCNINNRWEDCTFEKAHLNSRILSTIVDKIIT